MGMHFFGIVQGFFAVLVLAIACAILFTAANVARIVFFRVKASLRRPAKPRAPVKLRAVKPEPKPEEDNDDDADWLKDFG
jgi:hypothetical protein